MTASGLIALTVPVIAGSASRRFGARTVVVAAQALQACGAAGLALAGLPDHAHTAVLAACCLLLGLGQRAFWSSIFALIADAADPTSTRPGGDTGRGSTDEWFALAGMLQGAGFSVGALLGGALLIAPGPGSYMIGMAAGAAGFAFSGLLVARDPGHPRTGQGRPSGHRIHRDRPYLMFILVNTLFAFCSNILGVGLPLFVVDGLEAPGWLIGPLLALNTLLGATCQGLAVRRTARFGRVSMLAVSGLLWFAWGVATASLTLATLWVAIPGLVLTVILYSIAELIHAPFSMSLAADAAPAAVRAVYLSWFQYSFAVATMAAPGVFALTYGWGPAVPWLATSAVAGLAAGGILGLRYSLEGPKTG